ncbi:hypothetical protein AGMMS49982_09660 [Bacteroidia bacterium]|nr:hypothetical protein AGMMS49982_09660 [Bacteroidia bacterium]
MRKYVFESAVERELVHSYQTVFDGKFAFNSYEIDEIQWWSLPEISKNIGKSIFTPNFENEFLSFLTRYNTL